jgi:hypothetical protein
MMHPPPRVVFSTLAFPRATLASAASLGRRWGYAGVELRRAAEALRFLLNEASISWR